MLRLVRVARALRAVIVPAVVAALVAFPLGVLASHSFTDVPTTHPFHADIAALKDSGVSTTGCGGGKFCPDDFVTRGQMAAFLNRLGALGPGKVPVANATKLDGLDSTQFIKGTGASGGGAFSVTPGSPSYLIQGPGFIVDYVCPVPVTDIGALRFTNKTGATVHLFFDAGGANPSYSTLVNDDSQLIPALPGGDAMTIQFNAMGSAHVGTIWAFTIQLATECHVQAQWVETTS